MKRKINLFAVVVAFFLISCGDQAVYKEIRDFQNGEWKIANIQKFQFEINDNSQPLRINYMIRNAVGYPYYNLYLKNTLKDSTGKVLEQGMEELILFDEKTGKPKGDGLGDLFDHRIGAGQYTSFQFPYVGKYTFEIQQNMRPDPLVGLMSIGIEVEKISK